MPLLLPDTLQGFVSQTVLLMLLFFTFWLWFMCCGHRSTGIIKGGHTDHEKLGSKTVKSVSKELDLPCKCNFLSHQEAGQKCSSEFQEFKRMQCGLFLK